MLSGHPVKGQDFILEDDRWEDLTDSDTAA
jgi:hypothetical protein